MTEKTIEQKKAGTQSPVLSDVHAWMAAGLALTAFTAFLTTSSPYITSLVLGNKIVFGGLLIAELALVMIISWAINKISTTAASAAFLIYATVNGLTLSALLLQYSATAVTSAFVITAGTFAATSLFGYMTKRDLTAWGSFFFMGLIGVLLASIVNIFLQSPAMDFLVSILCVFVFAGLTVYDTNKIKNAGNTGRKGAILGALTLYLNFVNLFIAILRLVGRK